MLVHWVQQLVGFALYAVNEYARFKLEVIYYFIHYTSNKNILYAKVGGIKDWKTKVV